MITNDKGAIGIINTRKSCATMETKLKQWIDPNSVRLIRATVKVIVPVGCAIYVGLEFMEGPIKCVGRATLMVSFSVSLASLSANLIAFMVSCCKSFSVFLISFCMNFLTLLVSVIVSFLNFLLSSCISFWTFSVSVCSSFSALARTPVLMCMTYAFVTLSEMYFTT